MAKKTILKIISITLLMTALLSLPACDGDDDDAANNGISNQEAISISAILDITFEEPHDIVLAGELAQKGEKHMHELFSCRVSTFSNDIRVASVYSEDNSLAAVMYIVKASVLESYMRPEAAGYDIEPSRTKDNREFLLPSSPNSITAFKAIGFDGEIVSMSESCAIAREDFGSDYVAWSVILLPGPFSPIAADRALDTCLSQLYQGK
ncbi:MAG: hypothetical protein FWG30_04300 [Eubacteriaceae bacterium]|nr:hypothetical protein [Eubacteriaceae bacterium]